MRDCGLLGNGLLAQGPAARHDTHWLEDRVVAEATRAPRPGRDPALERAPGLGRDRQPAVGTRATGLKVSEKGGLSVYGLGRFPVTLYKEQWTKLLDMADEIRAFMKENDAKLKTKE